MDFKIVPRSAFEQGTPAELAAFNKAPVGTGPYVLAEPLDVNQVRFTANPHYRQAGKPYINEIVFHRLDSVTAKNQFLQGNIHLMFDVQPEHVGEIRQQRRAVKTLRSHSVWFLAPRYGRTRPSQLDDQNLRLAIAHSINRDEILRSYRTGDASEHVALTGPYPKQSWAYNDSDALSFSATLAKGYADAARKSLKSIRALRLVYPDNDPITENACKQIQTQVAAVSIPIELEALAPNALAAAIDDGNFDLAYWRHDFKDQTYWLWPLLDPQGIGPGGPNFMRYSPDNDLRDLFSQLNSHKRFPEIRKLTHKIHEHIFKRAIVIPLWQLDTYVAVDDALKNVRLDPWVLYGNVEEWNLQLRSK
jgi:ABC-type transport system substrate-binding protein